MALTKHQKLARELKNIFFRLDKFYKKVSKTFDKVQFHFYEPDIYIGRPLMTENALKAMILTHKYGIIHFSHNISLCELCFLKSVVGAIISHPEMYTTSHFKTYNLKNSKWYIPWKVKTITPSEFSKNLKKAYDEALLYCASEKEMLEWIDWFEKEDSSNTFINQLLETFVYEQEQIILKNNLKQLAYIHFKKAIVKDCGKWKLEKTMKTLCNAKFAPDKNTSIAKAYEKVFFSLKSRKERHLDEFKRFWKKTLEDLIFKNLQWSDDRKKALIENHFPTKKIKKYNERWETGQSIDRWTYSAYIQHCYQIFIKDPVSNKAYGEFVLFLWISANIAQDPDKDFTIKRVLKLTTYNLNIKDSYIHIDNKEIDISKGLCDLLKAFTDANTIKRHQKIFPNLNQDNIRYIVKKISSEILPPNKFPISPEAFLIFPHSRYHVRITKKHRKKMQKHHSKIYYKNFSWSEIKKQLLKNY